MAESFVKVAGVVKDIYSVISGVFSFVYKIGKAIGGFLWDNIKKVFSKFLEIQSTVGKLAADIGLTHKESHVLLQNMAGLALEASKFGGTIEDVAAIFSEFSQTTGKNRLFSKEDVGLITELGKGTGLGVQGAAQLAASFDNIGISLDKTIKLTDKARNMAARYNVNTTAVLKTYNELVSNLTGIGFGKGLDNLTKLAAKAQAMRFDIVSSTKAFTDAFFEPDKAAEAAAQMQVLGGAFAQSFGDPMQLAFESMNDPAKLADKFAGLVKGMVQKTAAGDFIIPPAARKQLQLASQALGQDYENIKNTAIEQAKITDKMTALGKQGIFNIKDDDKPALASLMKLNKDNKYEIRMSDGTTKLLENITDKRQLDAILDARNKNEKAAIERNNLAQRLSLIADRFMLGFSSVMTKLFGSSDFDTFLEMVEKVGTQLADLVTNKLGGKNGFFEKVTKTFNDISELFSDPKKSFGQKIFEALGKLGHDIAIPLVKKIFEVITPILQYGFGSILQVVGSAIPDILGGKKMTQKGIELQQNALKNSDLLQGVFGTNEQSNLTNDLAQNSNRGNIGYGVPGVLGAAKNAGLMYAGKRLGLGTLASKGGEKLFEKLTTGTAGKFVGGKAGGALANLGMKAGMLGTVGKIPIAGDVARILWGLGYEGLYKGDWKEAGIQSAIGLGSGVANIFAPGSGTIASTAIDAGRIANDLGAFDDGVIYKDGSYGKFGKGDMVQFMDQAAMERANTNGTGTASATINHTGTIRIESSDGKVVTWDQMYNARDMVGASLQSVQQSYNNGFGNYQNSNTLPIKPLV